MPSSLPSKDEAIRIEAALRTYLQPADRTFVHQRLARLRLVTRLAGSDTMSEDEISAFLGAQIGEYVRLLAEYPADIWAEACDAAPKRSQWFPTVAELNATMLPKLELRRRQHVRAALILGAIMNPRARVEHQPRTAEERRVELAEVMREQGLDPSRSIASQIFNRMPGPVTGGMAKPIDEDRVTPPAQPQFVWVMPDGSRVRAVARPADALSLSEWHSRQEAA